MEASKRIKNDVDFSEILLIKDLSVAQWKNSLKKHYLETNGYYGNQPLEWLNATPEELALAVGYPDATQDEVLSAFMQLFTRKGVRTVLADKVSKHRGRFAYENFHYLVLGCFVTATPIGAGENRDFRDRLGELLDGQGGEQRVSGLNSLWEALAEWANKSSSLRNIILPDSGSYTQIGVALKLAYPSWEDLAALRKILAKAPKGLQSRYALLQHIRDHQYELPKTSQHRITTHLEELVDRFTQGQAVENHPFWRIIERVLGDLQKTDASARASVLWRLSLDFYGADESGVDVLVAKGNRREQLNEPCWEGSFEKLLSSLDDSNIPVQIQQLLMTGTILLFDSPEGLWSQDDRPVTDVDTIILTNKEVYIDSFKQREELAGGWFVSEMMDYDHAKSLTLNEGLLIDSQNATREFSVEGGVKVRRGWWFGRPGYLPHINLPSAAQIDSPPGLDIRIENNVASVDVNKALDGRWDIQIRSDHFYKSLTLQFLSKADRNTRWPRRPENGFDDAQEVLIAEGNFITEGAAPIQVGPRTPRLLDALEAIYARAGGVSSEREILALLKPVLPKELNPWDLLRSLEEAGWLEQDVNTRWRGRRWRALPPQLVKTSGEIAIIEGATGQVELELIEAEAKRLGIDYFFNAEYPWSVPVIGVSGENLDLLAEVLNWPIIQARQPLVPPAPHCWFTDSRTPQGRQRISIWNPQTGNFEKQASAADSQQIQLVRYIRDDSQDLFCITSQGQPIFSTLQRLVALLEFARQTQHPLFVKQDDKLVRQAQWGYLPLCLAKWLRRSTARQTGPMPFGNHFTYVYATTAAQLKELKCIFGSAIGDTKQGKKQSFIHAMAHDRQRGQRSYWSTNRECN